MRHATISARSVLALAAACLAVCLVCTEDEGPTGPKDIDLVGALQFRVDNFPLEFYVNGVDLVQIGVDTSGDTTWTVPDSFSTVAPGGKLAVAVKVYNSGFTGGIIGNVATNHGTYVTDDTWKYSFASPAGWEQVGYDDGGWLPAYDYGGALETPVWVRNCDTLLPPDSCPDVYVHHATNARFIWHPPTMYFRKVFTVDTACEGMLWAAANGTFTVYLNGDSVYGAAQPQSEAPTLVRGLTVPAGTNVIAIAATATTPLYVGRGQHTSLLLAKPDTVIMPEIDWFTPPYTDTIGWDTTVVPGEIVASDSTWKVTETATAGWNTASFDDAAWILVEIPPAGPTFTGYPMDPGPPSVMWAPQLVCLRKEFTIE
jgi:hypothetical protein